jgi:hypothetical protein
MREFEFEMGADHAEFLRLLPAALGELKVAATDGKITARAGSKRVDIVLAATATRTLAALSLPVTRVVLRLDGYTEDEAARFLSRFRLVYQRGGG